MNDKIVGRLCKSIVSFFQAAIFFVLIYLQCDIGCDAKESGFKI
jgi:hypothetical protein